MPLPAITDAVVIDGYTQPGAAANTLVAGNNASLRMAVSYTHLDVYKRQAGTLCAYAACSASSSAPMAVA